jgi:hypothetical protein
MMDPETNRFEPVPEKNVPALKALMKQNKPAKPITRSKGMKADVFYVGEKVTIKSYLYEVESIESDRICFRPSGPIVRKIKR